MHKAETIAAADGFAKRRFGLCLAVSAALHVLVFGVMELPGRPLPQRAVLHLSLVPTTPPAIAAPPAEPAHAETAETGSATADPPAPQTATIAKQPSVSASAAKETTPPPPNPLAGKSALELARALAAGLAQPSAPSAAGRVLRLTDAPGRPDFAYYLEAWRRQVERVGKLNYPGEARRRKLTGSLRLLVVIRADGDLADARLVESSGHAVLDEAALRIVRLAAPYAPFPPRIAAQADTLEIERTWRFRGQSAGLL